MRLSHWLFVLAGVDLVANVAANNVNIFGTPLQASTASGQVTTLPSWYTSTFGVIDMALPVQLWILAGAAGAVAHFGFGK